MEEGFVWNLGLIGCVDRSGARVCVYDGKSAILKRTLARFKNIACGTSFRYDGKLIASGCKDSHVYVFDAEKGQLLR